MKNQKCMLSVIRMVGNLTVGHSGYRLPAAILMLSVFSAEIAVAKTEQAGNKETLIVTATRSEKTVSEVANTVSVIEEERIEYEIARNIADLVRFEPGVSVSGSGRFGLDGFNIRGIDGDRVLTLIDGVPTSDEFSFGPFLSSRRDFVDISGLSSVEIVRGPGSSIYGSNAIGGVVNFITKDPVDYLDGKRFAGSAKVGFNSIDGSVNTTLQGAFGNETLSGFIAATVRDGSETESFFTNSEVGENQASQNPQEFDNKNIYAKIIFEPNDHHRLSLTAERFDGETETNVTSAAGTFVRGVLVNSELGNDERNRERFSLDYTFSSDDSLLFDSVNLLAYLQDSDAVQRTLSERVAFGQIQERTRDSYYQQENQGLRLQFNKRVESSGVSHEVVYGVDYDVSDVETLREGGTVVQETGAPVFEFLPFPTRDFPNSEYKSFGAFIQYEVSLLNDKLHLIPALRYDNFKLNPSADEIFFSGNPGQAEPVGYDESQVSEKLGLIYDFNEQWSLYAQYAEGFRAPPLNAVNVGFTNLIGGYTTLSNPSLRPESGETYELGLRRVSDAGSIEFTVYQNNYDNFIEELSVVGFNFVTGLLEFQAVNLEETQIDGFEFKASYDLGALSTVFDGIQVRAAYAHADGKNEINGEPLNSIDPNQFVLGVKYGQQEDRWSVEAIVTATERKKSSDIDAASLNGNDAFETPGYAIMDLIGHVNVSDNLTVNWGIYNVTDKKYFQWSQEFIQDFSLAGGEGDLGRLTQAGRNYAITMKYDF